MHSVSPRRVWDFWLYLVCRTGNEVVVNGQSMKDILYIYFITLYFMCYMLLHVL